jgi:hypothetical protein
MPSPMHPGIRGIVRTSIFCLYAARVLYLKRVFLLRVLLRPGQFPKGRLAVDIDRSGSSRHKPHDSSMPSEDAVVPELDRNNSPEVSNLV